MNGAWQRRAESLRGGVLETPLGALAVPNAGLQVTKLDLKKELKQLYQPSKSEVTLVDVPSFNFLMVDGKGDPNTSAAYAEAVEALFSVSYTAKFMLKKSAKPIDYAVMPLEGLWWADDMSAFESADKSRW